MNPSMARMPATAAWPIVRPVSPPCRNASVSALSNRSSRFSRLRCDAVVVALELGVAGDLAREDVGCVRDPGDEAGALVG